MKTSTSSTSFKIVWILQITAALALCAIGNANAQGTPITATFQQGVNGYTGSSDTMLYYWGGNTNRNFGASPTYTVSGLNDLSYPQQSYGRQNILLKFADIFGPGGISVANGNDILSATLTMTLYQFQNVPFPRRNFDTLRVRQMLTPWEAGTGTGSLNVEGGSTANNRFNRTNAANYTAADYWGNTGVQTPWPVATTDFSTNIISDWLPPASMATNSWGGTIGVDNMQAVFDVTAAVKSWADGASNHGFRITRAF